MEQNRCDRLAKEEPQCLVELAVSDFTWIIGKHQPFFFFWQAQVPSTWVGRQVPCSEVGGTQAIEAAGLSTPTHTKCQVLVNQTTTRAPRGQLICSKPQSSSFLHSRVLVCQKCRGRARRKPYLYSKKNATKTSPGSAPSFRPHRY